MKLKTVQTDERSQNTDGEAGVQPVWKEQSTMGMIYSYNPMCVAADKVIKKR